MNREEFLEALEDALVKLPTEEKNDALSYYNEYFDDAGVGNEAATIKSLGPVKEIAARLNAEFAIKEMQENPKSAKKGLSAVWVVILALLATPIALPLAAVAFSFILCVLCIVFSVILTVWTLAISFIVGGFAGIVGIIFMLSGTFAAVTMSIGICLALIGIGVLLLFAAYWITKSTFRGTAYLFNYILNYRKKKGGKIDE